MLGTRRYNFQTPTPTLSATKHIVTDRWTDRQTDSVGWRSLQNQAFFGGGLPFQ